MPESFIPVWMSIGEAEEFRRFLQEEARTTDGEFPEREFGLIDSALSEERPRTFGELQLERQAAPPALLDEPFLCGLDSVLGRIYMQTDDAPCLDDYRRAVEAGLATLPPESQEGQRELAERVWEIAHQEQAISQKDRAALMAASTALTNSAAEPLAALPPDPQEGER